ncbi:MAG: efflux RND transporter periplasmic adaptor subunit [Peptococcaceae bacterium]|nr:efflux RND transporter periplasmic adaptor subunit [Peptococcaceae bacterium]
MWLKKKNNRIKVLVGFLALLILLVGIRVYIKKNTFDYYRLKPVDINQTVLASGRVSFPQPYEVTANSCGRISTINCIEGEPVHEGQLLIQMDDYQDRLGVQLALGDLDLARSKQRNIVEEALPKQEEEMYQSQLGLDEAEKEMNRLKSLYEHGAVPAVEYEKAANNYQLQLSRHNQAVLVRDSLAGGSGAAEIEARIALCDVQLKIAQQAVEDKKIVSPISGVISNVNFSPDQWVPDGAVLLTVLRQEHLVVEADVDQKELSNLEVGQSALVVFDAYPGEHFKAELTYISPQIDEQKGTCLLRLAIENGKRYIRHGMVADVEILTEPNRQVLALPKQFIDYSEKTPFVWVLQKGKAVKTPVTYINVGERWVIIENLPEDTLVLAGATKPGSLRIHLGREVQPDEV